MISDIYDNQQEEYLEIEDIEEELNEEFEFDMRKEWDDVEEMRRNLGNKIEHEQNDLLCLMLDE